MGSNEQGVTELALPSRRRAIGVQLRPLQVVSERDIREWLNSAYRLLNVLDLWLCSVDFVRQAAVVVPSVAEMDPICRLNW